MRARATGERRGWVNWIGLAILAGCYAAALANVFQARRAEWTHDVIRITHWQLELGVRDGINELVRLFEEKKAREGRPVRVIQIPVTERAYQQYITTQMIGGTAPDLVELGKFPREFYGRYFLSMSKVLQEPNPAIRERLAGLEAQPSRTPEEERLRAACAALRDASWMDTFTDGLRNLYNDELQEYFGVGFSQFTVRMFYNKDLFRAALGHDRPPSSYGELLEFCRRIEEYGRGAPRPVVPIASSRYQTGVFRSWYLASVTADVYREHDRDLNGWCETEEIIAAILDGRWSPEDPQYRAGIELVTRLARFFPRGFMSLDRMDSGFSFVQGRAAMITSGSWDARSYLQKILDQPPAQRFEVGIFDLPMPSRDDPEAGRFVDGRVSEASTGTGFAFGITRYTRHEDLCIEFLRFCTTPEANTILNRYAQWIPSVRGAEATELLKSFEPNYVGYWGQMNFNTGPRGTVLGDQAYWPLVSGEIDYPTYARRLMEQLPAEAAVDYSRAYAERNEALPSRRARRSTYLAQLAWGDPAAAAETEVRLLRAWDGLLPNYELGQRRLDRLMEQTRESIERRGHRSVFNDVFFRQAGLGKAD